MQKFVLTIREARFFLLHKDERIVGKSLPEAFTLLLLPVMRSTKHGLLLKRVKNNNQLFLIRPVSWYKILKIR